MLLVLSLAVFFMGEENIPLEFSGFFEGTARAKDRV